MPNLEGNFTESGKPIGFVEGYWNIRDGKGNSKTSKIFRNKITPPEPEPEELSDEKVKDVIHEVLEELYSKKK